MLADKQKEFAKCFEMGKYYEVSSQLEIATIEKDIDTIIATMKRNACFYRTNMQLLPISSV